MDELFGDQSEDDTEQQSLVARDIDPEAIEPPELLKDPSGGLRLSRTNTETSALSRIGSFVTGGSYGAKRDDYRRIGDEGDDA